MSLLHDIQASVVKEDASLASVLLKLKLLANYLKSDPLATWVRQELEGYDADEVPPYRTANVAYRGTFSGPFGSRVENAPIPPALIEKFAGEHYTRYKLTESISAIRSLALTNGTLRVDGADLILLLQGKVYAQYACNDVFGIISATHFVEVLDAVRSKVLDFTMAIGEQHPEIREVDLVGEDRNQGDVVTDDANRLVQQIIYANNVSNTIVTFEADLEKILVDRVRRSDSDEGEKGRMMDAIKRTGIQEVVKQLVQKTPDLLRYLSALGQ